MKFLHQLFGGTGLSWFGRSRSKATPSAANTTVAAKNNQNNSESTDIRSETVNKPDVACSSPFCHQEVADPDPDVTENCFRDFDGEEEVIGPECWSPAANRICWGSPVGRRSAASRRAGSGTESGDEVRTSLLPRSRSMIRTNPWLPPSSPPTDRRLGGLGRSPSPSSASCPPTQPPTPGDSPNVGDPARRWRLTEPGLGVEGPATAASEGYCSVSSLCTTSDLGGCTMSTAGVSDLMQISVDSLASLFPTTMSASSTSSLHDAATGNGAFSADSIVDSGIVMSSFDLNSIPTISDAEAQQTEDQDGGVDPASSDCGTPTNQTQTTSSPVASAAVLSKHLSALRSTIDHCDSTDYEFDPEVFPFSPDTDQPRLGRAESSSPAAPPPPPRAVEEISSSLASSVQRLRRGCAAVDGAFGRALAEDRRRERELARLRRRVLEAQRDVLLGTLKDLRRELDDQCRRLQVAYDAVLAARWPRLHAGTAYAARPTIGQRLPHHAMAQPTF